MSLPASELVDLSVPLSAGPSEVVPVVIEAVSHGTGGRHLAELAGVEQESLPDGLGWASERVTALTHAGTHVDAPYHYAPTCGGRPSRTIDELPVEWFWAPGVCVPVADGAAERGVGLDELAAFEAASGHTIQAGEIVLFRTGAEDWHGSESYVEKGRALAPELVRALVGRGVRVLGTDAWSLDPCFPVMRDQLARQGPGAVWAAHYVGRDLEFCAIERLCNLARLPASGFWLACFPVRVLRGSAGWTRAVAFLERVS
ncbi:MAG: cyclase family protein [Thermoanaerobaculia bacterium]